jgi:hypothetical protein
LNGTRTKFLSLFVLYVCKKPDTQQRNAKNSAERTAFRYNEHPQNVNYYSGCWSGQPTKAGEICSKVVPVPAVNTCGEAAISSTHS